MRTLALLLACLAILVPLAACAAPTTEPTLELRSPLWPTSRAVAPTVMPTGYAIPQAAAPAYVQVPQYAVPAPGACATPQASGYTPGYQFAPPPVPGACR